MGDENPIHTLGDYSRPSHEGYRNTIELIARNNMVPFRSDTIRLVQNGCIFHRLRSEDPNQHLKDFLKLVDSLDLDGTIDQSASGKLRNLKPKESWAILEDLSLYDNESWNDQRDFAKPVKVIPLPQDVPSTSDCRLIELENQVQCLMEAHLALTQPTQMNKITTLYKICSGPHDTQYSWKIPNKASLNMHSCVPMKWEVSGIPLSPSKTITVTPTIRYGEVTRTLDFKQQQSEMTNKIDTVLKAITDQIAGTLSSDTVKNPELRTHPVSSARSYPTMDPQCSTQIYSSINTITIHPKLQSDSCDDITKENEEEERDSPEIHSNSSTPLDPSISFLIEKVLKFNSLFKSLGLDDDSRKDEPKVKGATTEEPVVEYFDTFPTRDELTYHRLYLMRKSLKVLRKCNWMILGGQFNQLSHVSSPLLSKPGEY
nr:MAK10-like protein [Tanacetum cinerariifolium]